MSGQQEARELKVEKQLEDQLREVYTPGIPIRNPTLFSGRKAILEECRTHVGTGATLVIFGESGVGKTSFQNILTFDRRVFKIDASVDNDFVQLFRNVLVKLGETYTVTEVTDTSRIGGKAAFPTVTSVSYDSSHEQRTEEIAPRKLDLDFVLERLEKRQAEIDFIVIDEFQRVTTDTMQSQILEVVKGLANRPVDVTLVLIGLVRSDKHFIRSAEYKRDYLGRHVLEVHIPRMTDTEIADILERRAVFGIHFPPPAIATITNVSWGYPSATHRLARVAAGNWIARHITELVPAYLRRFSWLHGLLGREGTTLDDINMEVGEDDTNAACAWFASWLERQNQSLEAQFASASSAAEAGKVIRIMTLLDEDKISLGDLSEACSIEGGRVRNIIESDLGEMFVIDDAQMISQAAWYIVPYLRAKIVNG